MRPGSVVLLLFSFAAVSSAQVGELSVTFGESLFKSNKLGAGDIANLASQYTVGDGFRIGAPGIVDALRRSPRSWLRSFPAVRDALAARHRKIDQRNPEVRPLLSSKRCRDFGQYHFQRRPYRARQQMAAAG